MRVGITRAGNVIGGGTERMIVSYRTVFGFPAERLWIYAAQRLHGRGNMFWNP